MTDPAAWLDSKRLIGPHLFGNAPGALLEVAGEGAVFEARLARWRTLAEALVRELGWPVGAITMAPYRGGAMLALEAPVDVLYTATEVAETAWVAAAAPMPAVSARALEGLARARDEEKDPAALAAWQEARRRGRPAFLDEHGLQLGMGYRGRHWPPGAAPALEEVPWDELGAIPSVLVTGTNGKTTTTRLLAAMAVAAGHRAGLTSTDGAWVGDDRVDEGDVSGPGGARRLLRERSITCAILETARGGLLRRGLAVDCATAAIVTNIAADHLGDGGINDVDRLADVKFLVLRGLAPGGWAILNADDPRCLVRGLARCRAYEAGRAGPVAWFSLHRPDVPGPCAWLDGDLLTWRDEAGEDRPVAIAGEVPITLDGRARHNIANALAAIAAASAIHLPLTAIGAALRRFGRDRRDNAGRAMLFDLAGVRVLVDFGHNPAGMDAVLGMLRCEPGRRAEGRLHVMFGQAGDRPDDAIRGLARSVHAAGAARFVVKEMRAYRRGRAQGEVAALIRDELLRSGVPASRLAYVEREVEGAADALANADPGDTVALFVHSELDEVLELLDQRGARPLGAP